MLYDITHKRATGETVTPYPLLTRDDAGRQLRHIAWTYDDGGWSTSLSEDGTVLYAVLSRSGEHLTTEYRIVAHS
ncbi:hypothetical protein PBI_MRMAGOO_170 [Mycobacterium phage MrMagoo]|uniref:Uncharacterized protein n=1 Tax=Mycobacterium phage MrMagoo TaxID=1927020 RepID=A0A1L6BYS6_9CAUD|nr:hypothetical protein J4U04_gp110 [Mycobacterium phage MrMagoo]APQ42250.1 hypothetical protein PBI_MRMAGOO_170 [Mycobacterium phage MrMagoo]